MPFSKKRVLSVPGVTPLTFKDEALFRVAFPKDALYYAHSWMYVLRASHLDNGKLGYKFFSPRLVVVIGHRNGYIYVTPIVDVTRGIQLRQLCDALIAATGHQVIIKKIIPTILLSEMDSSNKIEAPLEDDSEPEMMLKLDKLYLDEAGTINPIAKRLIRKVRAFSVRSSALTIVDDIRKVPLVALERFLRQWPEKYASYISMVDFLHGQRQLSEQYRTMIFLENDTVKAIYIAERMSLAEGGLYCGVTARDEPGITEWMDVYFFRAFFNEGMRTVYIGGSEREGIAHFCSKLLPYKPEYTVRAMLYRPVVNKITVAVRPATQYDIAPLADVYRRAYNAMDKLGERWTKETAHKFISHFFRRQPDLFFVAESEGTLLGGVVAAIQPWWDGNHLVEGELFVDPRRSDKAIEKHLLKRLLVTARNNYQVVAWDTLMPVVSEHAFGSYENIGFREIPHVRAISGDMSTMLDRLDEISPGNL